MTNRNCCCKAVLSLSVKPNAVLQVQDRDDPFLNLNTKDKGVDATINGVNTLTLTATNGLELIQEGDEATISGLELQNSISSVSSSLAQEVLDRQGADTNLQNQIDVVSGNFSNYRTASAQDAIDNAQNAVINNKQDKLNEQQLSAVNSGITQTLVGQITTNKNDISSETTNRQLADNNLQSQIDAISASSDVTDIVGTYAELQAYDTSKLKDNDIVKVLQDESQNGETTYYRWNIHTETFSLIGEEGPYYTKSEANSTFVPQTRTVNGKALSNNISLDATDVGAATSAQGAKADTALQPSALNGYATEAWVGQQGYLTSTALAGYATQQYVSDNFQEKLESGTNIKTINNESILGSGNIAINALENTATGLYSLAILGNTRTNTGSTSIGYNSTINGYNSVALGRDSVANILGVAIGYNAQTQNMYRQIAIGANSKSSALDAIQIGTGTNSTASSLCIGFNGTNYELLDGTTGKIPDGRLPIATSVSSSSTNAEVIGAKLFYDTCGDIETLINAL